MMSSMEFKGTTAPDILKLNMENISKELNDMILTGEREYAITQQFQVQTTHTSVQSIMTTAPTSFNSFQVPPYVANPFYVQQQDHVLSGYQNMYYNLNCNAPFHHPEHFTCVDRNSNNVKTSNNLNAEYFKHMYIASTQSMNWNRNSNATIPPSYEFHYLPTNAEPVRTFLDSKYSLGGQRNFRKITKLPQKNFSQKIQKPVETVEEIKLDLYASNMKNSSVRQVFDLLLDLHCAIAATAPTIEVNSDSQYEETFAPPVYRKSTMPTTLNVQNQVKQACRKLTIFTFEMQRILGANKMYDLEMHSECQFYLNQLQQYLNQLEMYKRIVMEHKNGKFLRAEVIVHAERLSLLLEHTNRQILEVHYRILAVNWYIGVKYRGDVHLAADNNNKGISKKSKLGVINEILKMSSTIATSTNAQLRTAQPEITNNSSSKSFIKQEVDNVKPLLIKDNEICSNYKPDQRKRVSNISTGTHTRHPVFYIG